MKKSDRERRTDANTCKIMPEGYEPGPYEVLIGRGRRCTEHWGNQRFRAMIEAELSGYAAADCKRHKSSVISRILNDIKSHSPHAGFVKKDVASGRWLSLRDAAARVSIGQAFRDALEDNYRSSKHTKQIKRRNEKKALHGHDEIGANVSPSPTATPETSNKKIKVIQDVIEVPTLTLKPRVTAQASSTAMAPMPMSTDIGKNDEDDDFNMDDYSWEPLPLVPEESAGAPVMHQQQAVHQEEEFKIISDEDFNLLYQAFGQAVDTSGNPFEPLPMGAVARPPPAVVNIPMQVPISPMAVGGNNRWEDYYYQGEETNRNKLAAKSTPFQRDPQRDVRVAKSA